jgi:ribonuclease-3
MHLSELESKLSYSFQNKSLLEQALTHPSIGYESKQNVPDNQRMEFLGDAVIQLSLTLHLYLIFPTLDEGALTKLRSKFVSRAMLSQMGKTLDLGKYLNLGRGEEMNEGRTRESNLGNAMEAIIGAMFLDSDFSKTNAWLLQFVEPFIQEALENPDISNPKGELQEWLQGKALGTPTYELVEESGPDHSKNYIVAVKSANQELARGHGKNKKAAEMEAAAAALKALKPVV